MIEFYKTDLGLVLKNEDLIQVKSTYVRKNLTLDELKGQLKSLKEGKLHNSLKLEALDFIKNQNEVEKAQKINEFMQQFRILKTFEEVGLYFDDGLVQLNNIYTVDEILKSVNEYIDLF